VGHDRHLLIDAGAQAVIPGQAEELWGCERIYKNANTTGVRSLCKFQRKNTFGY
jgi:hypothetical protein